MKYKLSGEENFKKGKIRKTRLNSNGRSVSKIGKYSVQNWQSDPMNSPKAFGELKISIAIGRYLPIIMQKLMAAHTFYII